MLATLTLNANLPATVSVEHQQYELPVLTKKRHNPVLRLKVTVSADEQVILRSLAVDLEGTTRVRDVTAINVFYLGNDSVFNGQSTTRAVQFGSTAEIRSIS